MVNFAIGIAVGTAFAPFWMAIWNKYGKPTWDKVFKKRAD